MIGRVGDDAYGQEIVANLKANGVMTDYVEPVTYVSSGTAHIVLAEGDNSIIVVKGANDHVTPSYVKKALPLLKECDLVMIQQEVPEETVIETAGLCRAIGVPLLLNPAPAREIPATVIEQVAYLTPNEHEAGLLFPVQTYRKSSENIRTSSSLQKALQVCAILTVQKRNSYPPSRWKQWTRREQEIRSMLPLEWQWPKGNPLKRAFVLPIGQHPFP